MAEIKLQFSLATLVCTSVLASAASVGFAQAKQEEYGARSPIGLAIVRLRDVPREEHTDKQGNKSIQYKVPRDSDGGWTCEFEIVHWFREPAALRLMPKRPDGKLVSTVYKKFPQSESEASPDLQVIGFMDKYFLMEVNWNDNKLIGDDLWELPKLKTIEAKK